MNVYRACDIRGHAVEELSPHMYRNWGGNLGRKIGPGATFVVGGDVRPSTGPFLAALIEGLHRAGMKVVDLGIAPTPMVHFARWLVDGIGAHIHGSHARKRAMGTHVIENDAAGADPGTDPDLDISEQLGAGTDQHPSADLRVSVAVFLPSAAQGDLVKDGNVVVHDRRFSDHHARRVVDQNTGADAGGGVNIDRKHLRRTALQIQRELDAAVYP